VLRTVLIVDDNADARDSLAMLLGLKGFATATADDGREALDYLACHAAPALVVLDLSMPVLNGWEFLCRRRRDPALAGVPVVVLTAFAEFSCQGVLELGAQDCLGKPADPLALLDVVRRYTA
jgi:CheY-like chemotaxis protein